MAHVDSVYNFGKRALPVWITTKDIIADSFLDKDQKPILKDTGGLRKSGKSPNLREYIEEMVEQGETSRTVALMHKFAKINNGILEQLDQIKDDHIIFTDPVSPTKMDPQFLFSYLKHLDIPFPKTAPNGYALGNPTKVWHDPYSPIFAQTDAILLLAATNPDAFHNKIIWPVSPVAFPSRINAEDGPSLEFVFPQLFDDISYDCTAQGKIGLGSRSRSLKDFSPYELFRPPSIGTFEANARSFDRGALDDLLTQDPMSFETIIKKVKEIHDLRFEDAVEYVREEIAYDVFVKRRLSGLFYAEILKRLHGNPTLFAPKGSISYDILNQAIKHLNKKSQLPKHLAKRVRFSPKKRSIRLIGPDQSGPLDSKKRSPYSYLESGALERLNGHIVNPHANSTGNKPVIVRPELTKKDLQSVGLRFQQCPYAPLVCESVYPTLDSCARDQKEVEACSRDLFDQLKDPDVFGNHGLNQEWIDWYNKENPKEPLTSLADLVTKRCREKKFMIYSTEQVAWLLNNGPNYEVFTSSHFVDKKRLDPDDKRRKKARSGWLEEKGKDILFPFLHADFPAKDPVGRISSMGVKCDLARIIAVNQKIPPFCHDSIPAAFGTSVHHLMNGTADTTMLQERLWENMGLPTTSRKDYAEHLMHVKVGDHAWSGHSDCVLLKAPEYIGREDLPGQTLDLVIIDFKTAQSTYLPSKKFVFQLGTYAIGYDQLFPDINFRNFYLCVVTRPMVSELGMPGPYTQRISIVKLENSPDDIVLSEIRDEHKRTMSVQQELLQYRPALDAYKAERLKKGFCESRTENFGKCGCYDDGRVKCEKMFQDIEDRTLEQYLGSFQKRLPIAQ